MHKSLVECNRHMLENQVNLLDLLSSFLSEAAQHESPLTDATVLECRGNRTCCSDITNALVGISGETAPEGGNLRIY